MRERIRGSQFVRPDHLNLLISPHLVPRYYDHAPTLGSPTRICAKCPGSDVVVVVVAAAAVVSHGAAIPCPPGPALNDPIVSPPFGSLLGPYGFGNEFWRWRPCVTIWPGAATSDSEPEPEPENDVAVEVACCCCPPATPGCTAAAIVGEDCAFVIPGTEIKYTEPVGSVPP